MPRPIDTLIVHCADTPNGKPFTARDIDGWHRERGFERTAAARAAQRPDLSSIGYHFVIRVDGTLEEGRGMEEVGAHAEGHNQRSIGVCLIGRDRFTRAQWDQLGALVEILQGLYPGLQVIGHREVNTTGKTCPGFDVQAWRGPERRTLAGGAGEHGGAVEAAHLWPPAVEPVPAAADP